MGIFTLAWNSVLEIFKLVALPLTKVRGSRRFTQVLRWTLHVLAVAAILGCLAWLNYVLDVEQLLRTPWHAARRLWLPLMFGLIYTLAWLGWWLWRLAVAPRAASAHPDIDEAWREATAALEQAGIDLAAAPLFLLLGRPSSPEVSLFNATRIPLAVPQAPRRRDAPLHVYANEEGIYLTCAGASLLGRQAELYLEESASSAAHSPVKAVDRSTKPQPGADDESLAWGAPAFDPPADWSPSVDGLQQLEHGVALLVEEEQPRTKSTPTQGAPQTGTQPHRTVLVDGDELELYAARLTHLCRLVADARRPYCPINGVVVLAPLAATDSDTDANNLAAVIERDLAVLEETLCVSCPVVTLVCDLEQASGCQEFLERMPEEQRRRRLGITFPHVPAGDAGGLPAMIADGLRWLCQDLAPSLVYRLIPAPRAETAEADLAANTRRYQFLSQLRQRESRLARIVARGINPGITPWQLRGCYLAATGVDAAREQAFLPGVFPHLLQLQNAVAWTPAALREDRAYRLFAHFGYAALALFSTITIVLLVAGS